MSSLNRRSFCQSLAGGAVGRRVQYRREGVGATQDMALIIGQSLAAGGGGTTTAISTTQPYSGLMFTGGVLRPSDISGYASLISQSGKETIGPAFANQVAEWYRATRPNNRTRDMLVTNWAQDGQAYSVLKKGGSGTQYASSMSCVTQAVANLPSGRASINVKALLCVHGEADSSNVNYFSNLAEWQNDYRLDIQAATGQANDVPLFMTEWTAARATGIWGAWLAQPAKTVLVGPKYFLPYQDSLHLTSSGYVTLGEYYAKTYWQHVIEGRQWQPLAPTSVTRDLSVITVVYGNRTGDLAVDSSVVTPLADGNLGFVYSHGNGHTISSVSVTQPSNGVIQIQLSGTPSGTGTLSYAGVGSGGGPVTGTRGQIRDSDPMVSRSGYTMRNWAVNSAHTI